MQNMNKAKIKDDLKRQVARDKYDLPIMALKNIKYDVFDVVSKYAGLAKNDVKLQVQVLSSGKYKIQIELEIDDFFV